MKSPNIETRDFSYQGVHLYNNCLIKILTTSYILKVGDNFHTL